VSSRIPARWIPAALLAVSCVCAHASDPPKYQSKCLTPQHQRELNGNIQTLALKVTQTRNVDQRSRYQEELCKKLIQAEDYDNALRAALAVSQTKGIDEERRAVHHFLIAQIYALKMEASPTLVLMDQNRNSALMAVAEVMGKHYPEKWMIGDAARQLRAELQDPMHMAKVRAWVRKREACEGLTGGGASARGVSTGFTDGGAPVSYGVAEPAADAMGRVVDIRRDDFGARTNPAASGAVPGGQPINGDVTNRIEKAIQNAGALREPIVIDGMGRRSAGASPQTPSQPGQ
jgi:hypothetical protein